MCVLPSSKSREKSITILQDTRTPDEALNSQPSHKSRKVEVVREGRTANKMRHKYPVTDRKNRSDVTIPNGIRYKMVETVHRLVVLYL